MGVSLGQSIEYVLNGLIIAGAVVLVISLIATHKLIDQLPKSKERRNWYLLRALIVVFIAGYVSYTAVSWNDRFKDLHVVTAVIVPLIYFLGACFVYLVISFALDTAIYVRQFAVFELESITDPILGTHNRRYLDHRILYEVKRAIRYCMPLSILLLDIDYFNQIIETYGRQVGDHVLRGLGKLLLTTARTTDIVARFGKDQIMVIATNTPLSSMPVYAERLRKAVAEAVLVPPGEFTKGQVVGVTVSIGVAALGSETNTAEAMVKSAQDALAQAKAKGRNLVIVNKSGLTD
jgi:diguanylate cyclase (GGDEF)-like protein